MSLLLKNVTLNHIKTDIYIEKNRFTKIGPDLAVQADTELDCSDKIIFPSLINMHTHAAMTLMRGYADDMELFKWLNEHIWPFEAHMTEEDVYIGTKLACLEMIRTGTACFADMYWHLHGSARAVEEMGIRATLCPVFIDFNDPGKAKEQQQLAEKLLNECNYSDRVTYALGPHAPYTVSADTLKWCADFARANDLLYHIHLSETEKEVNDSIEATGKRPAEYLDSLGILGDNTLAAHCVWLSDDECKVLADRGCTVLHNPISNAKLASGYFPFNSLKEHNVRITIGTDGCSSNNNLDMIEEMKFAAMLAKLQTGDPTALPAREALKMTTVNAAEALRLDAGEIAEGKLADCILFDKKQPLLTPGYCNISDIVYSSNGLAVETLICDGKILMQNGVVPGQDAIIADACKSAERLSAAARKK